MIVPPRRVCAGITDFGGIDRELTGGELSLIPDLVTLPMTVSAVSPAYSIPAALAYGWLAFNLSVISDIYLGRAVYS
jgi:ABC-type phosphate transport system substrate-binding protein